MILVRVGLRAGVGQLLAAPGSSVRNNTKFYTHGVLVTNVCSIPFGGTKQSGVGREGGYHR